MMVVWHASERDVKEAVCSRAYAGGWVSTKLRTRGSILLKANTGKRTHVCNWPSVLIKHFDVRKSHLILHVLRKQTKEAQGNPSRCKSAKTHGSGRTGVCSVLLCLLVLKSKCRKLVCICSLQLCLLLGHCMPHLGTWKVSTSVLNLKPVSTSVLNPEGVCPVYLTWEKLRQCLGLYFQERVCWFFLDRLR